MARLEYTVLECLDCGLIFEGDYKCPDCESLDIITADKGEYPTVPRKKTFDDEGPKRKRKSNDGPANRKTRVVPTVTEDEETD